MIGIEKGGLSFAINQHKIIPSEVLATLMAYASWPLNISPK